MLSGKRRAPSRSRVKTAVAEARPQVTTIRLDATVQKGLRLLEAYSGVKRPLNKVVNAALADFIDRHAATLEGELAQALKSLRAYRKSDPGFQRAIKAFIESEVAHGAEDPMEGSAEPRAVGPAVSMVREMLRG